MDKIIILYTYYTAVVKIIQDNFNVIKTISNNPKDKHADVVIASNLIDKKYHEEELVKYLRILNPTTLVLVNYTRLVEHKLLDVYKGKIINIHNSLLPKYKGLKSMIQTWEAKEEYGGYTIHLVDEGIDTGKILSQSSFKINTKGTFEEFLEDHLGNYYETLFYTLNRALET